MEQQTARQVATRVSLWSMAGNILLTCFKLVAGFLAHSGAMISDGVHSASDVLSSLIVIGGVRVSARDPDRGHPYGHERFESLAAEVLAGVLLMVGGAMGWNALQDILTGAYRTMTPPGTLALVAAVVSIVGKEAMFRYTRHHARAIESTALMAEAWHHRSDALSSVGALIGVGGARLGFAILEPLASIVICLFIWKVAVDILREAVGQMVDRSWEPEREEELRQFVETQPGVVSVDLLRTRMFGSRVYVDLEISADGSLTLAQGHEIAEGVHAAVERQFPRVKHIMVHVNPAEAGNS